MISIQTEDFDQGYEYRELQNLCGAGAVVTFVGLVREFQGQQPLYLEHYAGMTEKVLQDLEDTANKRWDLLATRIIHRVGELSPSEQIVFVGVASAHRAEAFAANQFLIDVLKTQAPFWKREGSHWVEAKSSDQKQAAAWLKN